MLQWPGDDEKMHQIFPMCQMVIHGTDPDEMAVGWLDPEDIMEGKVRFSPYFPLAPMASHTRPLAGSCQEVSARVSREPPNAPLAHRDVGPAAQDGWGG